MSHIYESFYFKIRTVPQIQKYKLTPSCNLYNCQLNGDGMFDLIRGTRVANSSHRKLEIATNQLDQ